jgi:CheY-like chemotaxis protein
MDATPRGLLISGDLFFTSKVTGTADSLGLQLDVANSAQQATTQLSESVYACVLLDLTLPGLDVSDVIAALPQQDRPAVIAFGPHVQTQRLEAARSAGCDEVLPRSRFSAELPQLLGRFVPDNG